MSSSIEELVNAFNLNNYFSDNVYTNFTVEGEKIVGLFAEGTDVTGYLRGIREEIIKQQYLGREVVAGRYYNLNCFPFILGANPGRQESGIEGVVKVKLADSKNREVIRNLKIHLVNEFDRAVTLKLIARLVMKIGITKEEGHEWEKGAIKIGAFDGSNHLRKHYLYCIAFDGEYFEREGYDSETFELFKKMYIQEFNSRLEECGLKSEDFYEDRDGMLYIKDVDKEVVERVAKYVKGQVALSFEAPGEECSKVENFKSVLGGLIFEHTGKYIDAYGYDTFTDKREIKDGNDFVLIPLVKADSGQLESLKPSDRYKINAKYKNLVSDIKGRTSKPHITHCGTSVYAISNKGIAQLLPEIMQSPIAYNGRTGHFEFTADLGPSSRIDAESPRQVSPVSSPVLQLQGGGTKGTRVAVPADGAKSNPGPSMSGQSRDEDYMQDSSQSINTRNLSDTERIRKRRNSDGRSLSADSALSSEFDASRPPSGMDNTMTDDSGAYSDSDNPTSKVTEMGPLSMLVAGSPQNPFYTRVMKSCQDSSVFDTMEPDGKHKLDRGCPSRASSGSTLSLSSSTSDASIGTVIGIEDSSSESSPSRSASSEPPEKKSGRFSSFRSKSSGSESTFTSPTHDPGLPNGGIYDENMPGPSARLSQMELESSRSDQGKESKRFPRRESKEGRLRYYLVDLAGTGSGYQLPTQLGSTKVSFSIAAIRRCSV